ncbi:MAG TPA: hypothetical protein DCO72_07300 [Ruminococcus sp.]|nr:hypothetical protein [Ruminococcus sp.]
MKKKSKAVVYEPVSGIGKSGQALQNFGDKQNALNKELLHRLDELERENSELRQKLADTETRLSLMESTFVALRECIDEQKKEQSMNIKRFGRCAAALDEIDKEIDQLRLKTQLNSNAIDRMVKKWL